MDLQFLRFLWLERTLLFRLAFDNHHSGGGG